MGIPIAISITADAAILISHLFVLSINKINYQKTIFVDFDNLIIDYVSKNIKKWLSSLINLLAKKKVEPIKEDFKRIINDKEKISLSKKIGEKKKLFDKKFILPVNGRLSGVFGSQRILNSKPRRPHYGIDIAQKKGTPVIAPSSGKVKLVDYGMFFTGNTIVVDHGLGLMSIFAHLEDIFVEEGQKIKIGEKIGSVGMTGRATGPHLHWGIYLEKKPVDPLALTNSDFY